MPPLVVFALGVMVIDVAWSDDRKPDPKTGEYRPS